MRHRHARLYLTAAAAAALVAVGTASAPVFWQVASHADFLRGEVDNLTVDQDGRLSLGPATSLVHDGASPFLWTLLPGEDGAVFAGSGNEGKVFRIDRSGEARLFFDAPELEVHALAPARGGGLYVAGSPDGRVYRVDSRGQSTVLFAPAEKYIWSLAVDAAGNVYAGTGEKGVIYKISPDGKGAPFYRTRSTNVVSLAFDRSGNLIAGTESPARVFRIDQEGKAFVLLEASFREIHALRVDQSGTIYAAAVNGQKGTPVDRSAEAVPAEAAKPIPVPSVSTEITSISIIDVSAQPSGEAKGAPARDGTRTPKGAVLRIAPDGSWDTIWESADDVPYDVALEPDGSVLIGTGSRGRIFRVSGDPPRVTLVSRASAQQVTQLLRTAGGETLFATANPGKVFRLSAGRAAGGTYESEVKDALTVAAWGAISWRGLVPAGARIEIRTRSGNSQTPDDTWSPWSEPYQHADGQQVVSPKARYLQFKATFHGGGTSPVLTSVTTAYLPRNLRPRVTAVTVHPPGIVFQKPFSTGESEIAGFADGWPDTRPSPTVLAAGGAALPSPAAGPPLGRRIYQKGFQAVSWKAEDDNDDKLQYDVHYRREEDTRWRPLGKGLAEQLFVWDTASVPDGSYVLRVVASDAISNPAGTALASEAESATLDIDNTPPIVRIVGARRDGSRTLLAFEVRDGHAAIQRVDYARDAGRWQAAYPRDGICDSRFESFELGLDSDPSGVVIRAIDAMSNVATIEVPPGTVKK